jgi:putative ABC transport system permease protein
MGRFAWQNLLTRPLRTLLALVGLSIPILGILGLHSLSDGLKNLVGDTLSRIQGVIVLREGSPSPVFSDLKASVETQLRALPDVTAVAPEVWKVAPSVNGKSLAGNVFRSAISGLGKKDPGQQMASILDQPVICGQDIAKHVGLKSAIFPRAMLKPAEGGGRFLMPGDEGTNRIVISTKIARDNSDEKTGKPLKVGDSLQIGDKPFEIIGIYDTGSMLLDVVIVMDIATARKIGNVSNDTVSSFYVEGRDPANNDKLTQEIEQKIPTTDGRGINEIMNNFGGLMKQLDVFLLATVLLALLVGVVGIVNTMLMSTTERFAEFGVLRTLGWSRGDVLKLVTAESAMLGFLAGLIGFGLALLFAAIANQFIASTGLALSITPVNALKGLALSVLMGTLGGFYPAWQASRMVPMAAIRMGAR